MSDSPRISAIVPCRNERPNIEACVRSLLQQDEPFGGFELIIADGLSDDGTRDILQRLSSEDARVRVVDNEARTTAAGMNAGISVARGEYIAILGAHNRYATDYLARCLDLAQVSGADNVGGIVIADPQRYVEKAIAAAHHSPVSAGGSRWHSMSYEGPVDSVWGGFYHRDVFDRIGLFDEELIRNQDDELNMRLREQGGSIWQSTGIRSWYRPRSSLAKLFSQYQQYGYWRVRVMHKHPGSISPRQLMPPAFVGGLSAAVGLTAWRAFCAAGDRSAKRHGRVRVCAPSLAIMAPYGLAITVASVRAARTAGWDLLPLLPAVFACYHLGYGAGFWLGAADLVRRAPARPSMSGLTR